MADDHHLRRLLDLQAIHELKARYCRFVDTKQWDRLRTLFASETRFEGFGSAPTGADVDAFIGGISTRLARAVSIHHCHMPEIVFTGPDSARGIWAMMDLLQFPLSEAPREAPGSRGFRAFGHYEEAYRREGDVWLFCFLRLTRLRIDPLPADHPEPRTDLLAASPDWLEHG